MFNNKKNIKSDSAANDNFSANTIQNSTTIEGHIKSEGSIRIDGVLNGSITTKGKLVVGKTGIITGDVSCQNASIEGTVEGKMEVLELLDLKATAKIEGDIYTSKLVVEPGAVFNGACRMDSNASKAKLREKTNVEHKQAV